jgi:hypothetical protein
LWGGHFVCPAYLRRLFLRGHLRIGIAPCAQLEAPANPAQAFGRNGSAFLAADDAAGGLLHAIRFNCQTGLLNQSIGRHGFHGWCPGQRRFAFLSHHFNITSASSRALQVHNVAGIERAGASGAFLTPAHFRVLRMKLHRGVDGVGAHGAIHLGGACGGGFDVRIGLRFGIRHGCILLHPIDAFRAQIVSGFFLSLFGNCFTLVIHV